MELFHKIHINCYEFVTDRFVYAAQDNNCAEKLLSI